MKKCCKETIRYNQKIEFLANSIFGLIGTLLGLYIFLQVPYIYYMYVLMGLGFIFWSLPKLFSAMYIYFYGVK